MHLKNKLLAGLMALLFLIPVLFLWLFDPFSGLRSGLVVLIYLVLLAAHEFAAYTALVNDLLDVGSLIVLGTVAAAYLAVSSVTMIVFLAFDFGYKIILFWNILELLLEVIADMIVILLNGGMKK